MTWIICSQKSFLLLLSVIKGLTDIKNIFSIKIAVENCGVDFYIFVIPNNMGRYYWWNILDEEFSMEISELYLVLYGIKSWPCQLFIRKEGLLSKNGNWNHIIFLNPRTL